MADMKGYVWHSRSTCITGRNLARELRWEHGRDVPGSGYGFVLCWGRGIMEDLHPSTRARLTKMVEEGRMLNSPFVLARVTDKFVASQEMLAHHVATPWTALALDAIVDGRLARHLELPLVGRHFRHQAGSCFVFCDSLEAVKDAMYHVDYFSEYIDIRSEYRVHVFKGRVIGISGKIRDREFAGVRDERCRVEENGWEFVNFRHGTVSFRNGRVRPRFAPMAAMAIKAVGSLGLAFGGVDIGIMYDGRPVVFEVNSGCSLGKENLLKYKEAVLHAVKTVEGRR